MRALMSRAALAFLFALLVPLAAQAQSLYDMAKRVESDINKAEASAKNVDSTRTTKASAWRLEPSFTSRKTTADARLAEARLRLKTGQTMRDPLELTRASALVSRAIQEYESIARDIRNWKPPRGTIEPPAPEPEIPPVETPPDPKIEEKKPPTETPSGEKPRGKESTPETPPAPEPPPTVGPPPELHAAATAYLSNDYKTTVGLLEQADFPDDRTMAHALLLRSAARYALYFLGGEKDATLIRAAGIDAAECKKLQPSLVPSDRLFSPRYQQFFAKAGAATGL